MTRVSTVTTKASIPKTPPVATFALPAGETSSSSYLDPTIRLSVGVCPSPKDPNSQHTMQELTNYERLTHYPTISTLSNSSQNTLFKHTRQQLTHYLTVNTLFKGEYTIHTVDHRVTHYPITFACVTRPERQKGTKDQVKRGERASGQTSSSS